MTINSARRHLIMGLAGLLVTGAAGAVRRLAPTPQQTAGPFYPETPPLDDDSDLTRVRGRDGVAQGRITDLSGRILDSDARPLGRVRVEIWQCDATGRYHHPRDRGTTIDRDFQGFGHTVTDGEGNYRFRTIRPVPYPGRTPHIHMAVFAEGAPPFVTQLYINGEPRNADDFIFNHIPDERRQLVVADFVTAQGSDAELKASFDIVLAGAGGTPQV
ncbi:MAG: protocatechuate 3,4-dioxygenase [Gammaproteobacteria bacterium]|nr:protocatechuate 3,4-dioxygenase [Gammaproteobacteria bacterium]